MNAVVKISYILTTYPYFHNLQFKNFNAGGPECHFITSVTITNTIQNLKLNSNNCQMSGKLLKLTVNYFNSASKVNSL